MLTRPLVFLVFLASAVASAGQDPFRPIRLADLPADYRAVDIRVSGQKPDMGPLMAAMRGGFGAGQPPRNLIPLLTVSWTKFETTRINDVEFIVTYKPVIGPVPGSDSEFGATLRMNLVRRTDVLGITPYGELKPSDLLEALRAAKIAIDTESMPIEIPGDPMTAAILFPVFSQAKSAAQKTNSLSNIKQIGLAMLIYASDYDDVLPYVHSTKTVQRVLDPYMKNMDLWKSPNPNGGTYYFNMALAGVSLVSVDDPVGMPMFYESTTWPDGRRAVVYADGHAKLEPPEVWAKLEKLLKTKLPRAAKRPLPP